MEYANPKYLLYTTCLLIFLTACGSSSDSSTTTYSLTVLKAGDGSGQVTSTPAGIDCGFNCIEPFDAGAVITLNPVPDSSNEFLSWSGDADCTDGIVTLNTDVTCTATFNFVCDVLLQNCPGITDACYLSFSTGSTVCATPFIETPPAQQGDACSFLNGCAAGYNCILSNVPINPTGLDCALSCDPITPNTGCDAAGAGLTCVQINQFYSNSNETPDEMGMCVDCAVFTCP